MTSSPQISDKRACNWNMKDGVNEELFDTMMSLLLRVDKCELAVVCSSWIIKVLPMGQCYRTAVLQRSLQSKTTVTSVG